MKASKSFLTNHPQPTSYLFVLNYQDPDEEEQDKEQGPMTHQAADCSEVSMATQNADEVNEEKETATGSRVQDWINSLFL